MTSLSVSAGSKELTSVPGLEVQTITLVASGDYYISKFSTVVSAMASSRSRTGAYVSAISGGKVTVTCASASSDVVDLWIWGY